MVANPTELITSDKNTTVKLVKALLTQARQRKKHEQTVIEGVHLIDAALRSDYPFVQILLAEAAQQHPEVQQILSRLPTYTPILILTDALYASIRSLGTGIDIMAILKVPTPSLSMINNDCLILNDVQDSGNVGTLLRTAAAVGIQNILCTSATAQAWSPKTLRAGMGAQFALTIYEGLEVQDILNHVQTPLFATSSHTDTVIYQHDLKQPVAWIMGHEGQGVCDELMQCATPIALPQPNGQESLNVAIAGSLCLYETLRQRSYSQ
ncbi:TrmH family RNA methyltransferase [Psychrobacter sp. AOP22-C1-22]|uniref:TrmH family RNA methyltransferase n=1 Tax=unclassified Psychrobacter TaxID=196806 RepID=UPI0017888CCF|nr:MULTISPECIES: RNA methyltransferase [unclassified Psychrobacter]MBE0406683.1 RNA methyltransferase [Psychrobacter sp. FME6]MBE0443976.1 RNA methyltransferase [Psychrobacter sp. FME5]MDN5802725.1 RNA methyltransferase [Psychrobacter sp.]MDN5890808.1 RNA methyltransferase [Psychrobacter sp.]